jgi:hypothetical protein
MNQQVVIYLYDEILLSNEEEWAIHNTKDGCEMRITKNRSQSEKVTYHIMPIILLFW